MQNSAQDFRPDHFIIRFGIGLGRIDGSAIQGEAGKFPT